MALYVHEFRCPNGLYAEYISEILSCLNKIAWRHVLEKILHYLNKFARKHVLNNGIKQKFSLIPKLHSIS